MRNKDELLAEKQEIMSGICDAVNSNDNAKLLENMTKFQDMVQKQVRAEYDGIINSNDNNILAARGVRALTSAETKYWNAFITAFEAKNESSGIVNIEEAFPETIIDTVVQDIQTKFPLLDKLNFINATAVTKWIINKSGIKSAKWGKITSAYTEELSGDIDVIDAAMCKLTAYMCIPKDILDMGPSWVDRYVRAILTEASGYGLENGVINGTGKDEPIGMTRNISSTATVVSGVYPEKTAVKLTSITPATVGEVLASMCKAESSGRIRTLDKLILICNPLDYYSKVMPATTILLPTGGYVNNVLPVPMEIVQSVAMTQGKAVIADASKYTILLGAKKRGFIERDDSVHFIEDESVYATKLHANGRAGDDNDCKLLDISELETLFWGNAPAATAVSTKKAAATTPTTPESGT